MTSSNLTLIETVTSAKLANKINSQVKQGTLGVFVQVMASWLQQETHYVTLSDLLGASTNLAPLLYECPYFQQKSLKPYQAWPSLVSNKSSC